MLGVIRWSDSNTSLLGPQWISYTKKYGFCLRNSVWNAFIIFMLSWIFFSYLDSGYIKMLENMNINGLESNRSDFRRHYLLCILARQFYTSLVLAVFCWASKKWSIPCFQLRNRHSGESLMQWFSLVACQVWHVTANEVWLFKLPFTLSIPREW